MISIILVAIGIYFSCTNYFAVCNTGAVFACTGCNAILEWNLDNVSSKLDKIIVKINNSTGNVIAECQYDLCAHWDNLSVKCIARQEKKDLNILLSIINVTVNHSGKYTAWIKQGIKFKNDTKQLIVKDMEYANCSCYSEDSEPYTVLHYCSRTVHQECAGPSNREVPQELVSFENHDRPLTVPAVHDNTCRTIRRLRFLNVNRKSRSLQTLMNHTQDFWNPVRQSFSLQTLIQLSHAIKRNAQSDDSLSTTCCSKTDSLSSMDGFRNGIRQEKLYSRVRKDDKVSYDQQNTDARSLSLNNFEPQSFDQQPQEDQYSTIDEARQSVHHCVKVNKHDENLQEDRINTEAGNNDYDYATLPAL